MLDAFLHHLEDPADHPVDLLPQGPPGRRPWPREAQRAQDTWNCMVSRYMYNPKLFTMASVPSRTFWKARAAGSNEALAKFPKASAPLCLICSSLS